MNHQVRAWVTMHQTRSAIVLLLLTCVAGGLARGMALPAVGPVSLPASFPVGALLPVVLGVAVGLFCHTVIDQRVLTLAPRRHRLVPVRALWVVTGTGTAALAGHWVLITGDYAGSAVVANVVLFAGLALALVVVRRPDQAWLPSVTWCLVAMVFGYRGDSSGDWYWWAFPLDPDVTTARMVFTCAVWGTAALVYSGRPLLGPGRLTEREG